MEIQKIFSELDTNEKLYSVLMTEDELDLYQSLFSEKKEKDGEAKLKFGDKANIWALKHLNFKGDREAMIEAYDTENGHEQNGHRFAKRAAVASGAGFGIPAVAGGAYLGYKSNGVKGALAGAGIGAAATAATGAVTYGGTRLGIKLNKEGRKVSRDLDDRSQRLADRAKVANGDMTKAEYAKKWNKK